MPRSEFAEATLPTQHLVTLALHAVFLESRFSMREAGALGPKGSVGRGQDRPRGEASQHTSNRCPLYLPWDPRCPQHRGRATIVGAVVETGEKDFSSLVGGDGAEK